MLKDMGEFVQSASSTVEAPVEKTAQRSWRASRRRPGSRRRRLPQRRHPPPTPTAKQPRASLPRRWTRPSARPMVRPPLSTAAPSGAASQAPPEARPGEVPPARTDGQSGPGEPPADQLPAASRTSPRPVPQMPSPRPGDIGGSAAGPRPRPGATGGLPGGQGPGRRTGVPRPGNNPFSSSQGMGQPRAPRPGAADPARPGGPRPPVGPCPDAGRPVRRARHAAAESAMMPKQAPVNWVVLTVVGTARPRWKPAGGRGRPGPSARTWWSGWRTRWSAAEWSRRPRRSWGRRARSDGPGVRLAAAGSPRSSVVKSSIRWKRRRSAVYGSSKVMGRPSGSPAAPHRPGREDRCRRSITGAGAVPAPGRDGYRYPVGER